jgi:hypothetical protein
MQTQDMDYERTDLVYLQDSGIDRKLKDKLYSSMGYHKQRGGWRRKMTAKENMASVKQGLHRCRGCGEYFDEYAMIGRYCIECGGKNENR